GRLELRLARSAVTVTAGGDVTATEDCAIRDVESSAGVLSFTRRDQVLPILPPGPLPPRLSAPAEAHSRYLLEVTCLGPGQYESRCEGQPTGAADAQTLAVGVDVNSLILDGGREAPWQALSQAVWDGRMRDCAGRTRWRFEVRKL